MTESRDTDQSPTGERIGTSRRDCLRGAAAATAIPAGIGLVTARRNNDHVIEVSSGETFTKRIGDGETFSDKLIDITSENSSVEIIPRGSGWTVANIGVKGTQDHGASDDGNFVILPEVAEGGRGEIRNVHISPQYHDDNGGMLSYQGHAGELIVERCYVEGFANNSTYLSPAGRRRPAGSVTYRNCYFKNSVVSQYRTASPGCEMQNCVAVFDGKAPSGYPLGPGNTVRGCWIRAGEMTISDSDILIEQGHDQSGPAVLAAYDPGRFGQLEPPTVELHDTRVEGPLLEGDHGGSIDGESAGSPTDRVPDGCPTSPGEAASGGA